jgi:hypothetical protein
MLHGSHEAFFLEKTMIQLINSAMWFCFRSNGLALLAGSLLVGFVSTETVDAQDTSRQVEATSKKDQLFFNQSDLRGWHAKDMDLWSVEDGAIVGTGGDSKINGNQFLYSKIPVKNFRLKLKVKQVPYSANAGIQFRSTELNPSGQAVGYQADVGKGWWGSLYHEHGRGILARNEDSGEEHIRQEDWNDYEILVIDHRIWLAVNGRITVALDDPDGELTGLIALQIHGGPAQRVAYKDLELTHNPRLTIAGLGAEDLNKKLKRFESKQKKN